MLEWREREHEALDSEVIESDQALEALSLCELKKFIEMSGMLAQPWMLEMSVGYWDPYSNAFILERQPLWIEVEDIYFLTGLSRRREVASFKAHNIGGMAVEEYIALYCIIGMQKVGT